MLGKTRLLDFRKIRIREPYWGRLNPIRPSRSSKSLKGTRVMTGERPVLGKERWIYLPVLGVSGPNHWNGLLGQKK